VNLIQFWQDQVNKWNEETKCGFCWEFGAPLTESAVELFKPKDGKECCVQVLLVRDKGLAFSTSNTYNNTTGFLTGVTCNTGFSIYFVLEMDLGTNNYNEIKDHSIEQAKWKKLVELEQCLSCEVILDFCEFIGSTRRITTWQARQVINHTSKNYSGYLLTVNFQNIA
jgi:hypothetical protein